MTRPAGSFSTFEAIGQREDLKDFISTVSPKDVPFQNAMEKVKARATYVEWQTDALAAADTANAQVEGDDSAGGTVTPTARIGNRTQISTKPVVITGTLEAVARAGRAGEMAYQLRKKTYELRRDMEAIMTQNQASVTGNSTTARKLGSLETMLTTNAENNGDTGGGFSASQWTVVADGTLRSFTETLLKSACQKAFTSGGDPDLLMLGAACKQIASGFTGNAQRVDKSEDKKVTASVDVYESDFGEFRIKANRFQRARTGFLLETDLFAVANLRPLFIKDLGDTGDATKKMLICEYTLVCKNEAGSAIIRSIQ